MTNEEAKMIIQAIPGKIWNQLSDEEQKAMEMTFKALENQCEDCISREAARDLIYHKQEPLDEYDLDSLPSVTPKPKEGHWIHFAWSDECSVCGYDTGKYGNPTRYCPECGSLMKWGDD